jgi:hypothetical protein
MAISTLDSYIASVKQRIPYMRNVSRTTLAGIPFTTFDVVGNPGVGVLPGTSTTVPVMPTSSTAGMLPISFSTGTGYLSKVEFGNTVSGRFAVYDLLSKSGAYAFTAATTTIATPLNISSRCPDFTGGATFGAGNEIWIEVSTAFATGNNWTVQVTYKNQGGVSHTSIISPVYANSALTLGRMFQIALAAGDTGVQTIDSVIVTNGTTAMNAGAFNVLIMRPVWTSGRVPIANASDIHDLLKTGMPVIYNTSALYPVFQADSTSTGFPELVFEIASG